MYFEFFYQIAPICLIVGIPFLVLLIGTALFNSLQLKRERAKGFLATMNPSILAMLSEMTVECKGLSSINDSPAFFKEFETRKSLFLRAIEIGNAEKIVGADYKLLGTIKQYLDIPEYHHLAMKLMEIRNNTLLESNSIIDDYNIAAKSFNAGCEKFYNKPVVSIMNLQQLTEVIK